MPYKRPNADERFKRLIDEFNFLDEIVKEHERKRELVKKKLRNIIRRRGRGVHNGHESSISAYDVIRSIIDQDKVKEYAGPDFNSLFKDSKYIAIEGGPLKPPSEVVPELGPPKEVVE